MSGATLAFSHELPQNSSPEPGTGIEKMSTPEQQVSVIGQQAEQNTR